LRFLISSAFLIASVQQMREQYGCSSSREPTLNHHNAVWLGLVLRTAPQFRCVIGGVLAVRYSWFDFVRAGGNDGCAVTDFFRAPARDTI
jgi:hypothetical protein